MMKMKIMIPICHNYHNNNSKLEEILYFVKIKPIDIYLVYKYYYIIKIKLITKHIYTKIILYRKIDCKLCIYKLLKLLKLDKMRYIFIKKWIKNNYLRIHACFVTIYDSTFDNVFCIHYIFISNFEYVYLYIFITQISKNVNLLYILYKLNILTTNKPNLHKPYNYIQSNKNILTLQLNNYKQNRIYYISFMLSIYYIKSPTISFYTYIMPILFFISVINCECVNDINLKLKSQNKLNEIDKTIKHNDDNEGGVILR